MITRGRFAVLTLLLSLPIAVFIAGGWGGFRINFSPSYPLGLWRIATLDRAARIGDRIFICPPRNATFELARRRGYLRQGLCPGWLSPLIKTVVATSGHCVGIAASVTIDGRDLPHSELQAVDGSGRSLPPYPGGAVPSGFLFLHSPFKGSYDSRYFGPIPAKGVLGLATPILTFGA
ncbi:conjugative transfer signal peptidase TraF [Jiella pacifica]|uniref:Conjugative transfer signal peptidase TraF n=1 Tax=Jiella pacifica TaxID=2696469 RepID=A0A6N9T919_9HYPH|nr:conjugative transfer signal peptidase TraF [Jiella pacifica]NDW07937.1 conjugative transfer signal peptidase TraF [Jiella pacifica]